MKTKLKSTRTYRVFLNVGDGLYITWDPVRKCGCWNWTPGDNTLAGFPYLFTDVEHFLDTVIDTWGIGEEFSKANQERDRTEAIKLIKEYYSRKKSETPWKTFVMIFPIKP